MTDIERNGLLDALVAFQSEVPPLHRGSKNPHFGSTYASLDTTVKTVTPILCKHGLVWTALPGVDENGAPVLNYRLAHAPSGESLEGKMPLIIEKGNAQGFGSALTYARRYALTAVLNLVDEEDDDGNRAAAAAPRASTPARPQSSHDGGQGRASEKQHKFLVALLKKHHLTAAAIRHELMEAGVNVPAAANVVEVVEGLSGKDASAVIEKLKDRPVEPVTADAGPVAKELFAVPAAPPVTGGHYGSEES